MNASEAHDRIDQGWREAIARTLQITSAICAAMAIALAIVVLVALRHVRSGDESGRAQEPAPKDWSPGRSRARIST